MPQLAWRRTLTASASVQGMFRGCARFLDTANTVRDYKMQSIPFCHDVQLTCHRRLVCLTKGPLSVLGKMLVKENPRAHRPENSYAKKWITYDRGDMVPVRLNKSSLSAFRKRAAQA